VRDGGAFRPGYLGLVSNAARSTDRSDGVRYKRPPNGRTPARTDSRHRIELSGGAKGDAGDPFQIGVDHDSDIDQALDVLECGR
jgi:hypothetical protein